MTFTERCKLSTDCLPDAPYRAMLENLHREMLDEIERTAGTELTPEQRAVFYASGPRPCLCNERTFCWCRDECERDTALELHEEVRNALDSADIKHRMGT